MARLLATYRLQLRGGVGLRQAARLVPYLDDLGVSHLYLSPLLRARRGSAHGYDIVDPGMLDPALGTERDLAHLVRALRRRGMGLALDIVPNHMATGRENRFWDDVLARGRKSPYAGWFDVDWAAGGHRGGRPRIVLPVLGDELARVVRRGKLRLDWHSGRFRVAYHEHSFPVNPTSLPDALRTVHTAGAARRAARRFASGAGSGERWHRLLARQFYRLAYWRRAAREINYRRFFTIADLVALRVGDPEVFRATHALVQAWVRRGWVDALRIDHVDGLRDPLTYLERLRDAQRARRTVPVYVEKVLARGERLRDAWPVAGTTGYDFLAEVEDVFISPRGYEAAQRLYRRVTGRASDFPEVVRWAKRKMLRVHLRAEVRRLTRRLQAALEAGNIRSVPPAPALARALCETIVHLDVYRTYVDGRPGAPRAEDRRVLTRAVAAARRAGRAGSIPLALVRRALLLRGPRDLGFVERFQHLCVTVAAKGVEDTALYAYVALVSRNEVGAAPDTPLRGAPAVLHGANAVRARRWPGAMLVVSTHDTKRSADVRARIDALSEIPDEWGRCVRRWRRWHARHRRLVRGRAAPDASTEYLFYQTLVGLWPSTAPRRVPRDLGSRVEEYVVKAAREAKRATSWVRPDPTFETALRAFARAVMAPRDPRFLVDLANLVAKVAPAGMWNALARTLVQLTAPGVPDVYQGDELWSFALVDPDNRRPVDWTARRRAVRAVLHEAPAALVRAPHDGRLKLYVTRAALAARRRFPGLFVGGTYEALALRGRAAKHLVAFARRAGERWAVAVVPRLTMSLGSHTAAPCGEVWRGTHIVLPGSLRGARMVSALTGDVVRVPRRARATLPADVALADLPVALLIGQAP